MKRSYVLWDLESDALRLRSAAYQAIKWEPSLTKSIILFSKKKNHISSWGEKGGSLYTCRGQFSADKWWLLAEYCTVCACYSLSLTSRPSGRSEHQMQQSIELYANVCYFRACHGHAFEWWKIPTKMMHLLLNYLKRYFCNVFFLFKNIPDTIYIQKIWLGAMFTA